jgi:hypothetical protein
MLLLSKEGIILEYLEYEKNGKKDPFRNKAVLYSVVNREKKIDSNFIMPLIKEREGDEEFYPLYGRLQRAFKGSLDDIRANLETLAKEEAERNKVSAVA